MNTIINSDINLAVELLKAGEVVALPTETVYGLAGNALDPAAITKIFAAKKRPQDNPLIIHVTGIEMVRELGLEIPDLAERLAESFWAGALTIIFKKTKTSVVPMEVSRGLDSVAVRVPDNSFFLETIRKCGFPLAAPSANLSGSPSPTRPKHVYADLNGRIPLIIDGGHCRIGIESTVIIIKNNQVKILRPGAITPEMLSEFAHVTVDDGINDVHQKLSNDISPSPGTKYKHYSPKAKVYAVIAENEKAFTKLVKGEQFVISRPAMQTLFARLRRFDQQNADKIYIRLPKREGIGFALYNRIIRAAEFNIIRADNIGTNNE
ncbi:MAG: L-threonylcarbamoyladenylate synthase [Oscillospiraceae bacterium]|nr:L-threonylcarbamoyladenylate synthase [Oscillospiraceae bacterium]